MRTVLIIAALLAGPAVAQDHSQPYKGFEARGIASLSESDIAALQSGEGWGLALPAELNGYPGPRHVLDLSDELGLSADQTREITAIFEAMQTDAIAAGTRLIQSEQSLDQGFRDGALGPEALSELVAQAEAARAELRFVHLSRHLATRDLLTPDQIAAYAVLRGYSADPCDSVPKGHDPELWRRHNGCTTE